MTVCGMLRYAPLLQHRVDVVLQRLHGQLAPDVPGRLEGVREADSEERARGRLLING